MVIEFATATRILFGAGAVRQIGPAAAAMGRRAMLVTGRSARGADSVSALLAEAGVACAALLRVEQEPTVDSVAAGAGDARQRGCDMVVGVGGGSVVDTAKAVAALLTNPGEPLDYVEGIGRGKALRKQAAPCIAIPTTAGTGSEVTRNAVLGVPSQRSKVSMRSAFLLPALALVDPELTCDIPPSITANTGLDALTQLLEAFLTPRATPITDGLCREGLSRAARSLRACWRDGSNKSAREDMAMAALCSGMALANAGLGAVHGLAGPLGGLYSAPHGGLCARLLPGVMAANLFALRKRAPMSKALARFDEVAQRLTDQASARAEDGIAWLRALCEDLRVTPLAAYGVRRDDFHEIIARSRRASSMRGNPIELTDDEMQEILDGAY